MHVIQRGAGGVEWSGEREKEEQAGMLQRWEG
jgi:hypothetical protein